jgi:hypothetical protein
MMISILRKIGLLSLVALLTTSCGGGGGGDVASGGISGTVMSSRTPLTTIKPFSNPGWWRRF